MIFAKTKIIILIAVIAILIIGGLVYYGSIKISEEKEVTPEEVFALTAIVSEVGSDFLMVKPIGEEKEIKVSLSKDTELIRLEFPFDLQNPPKEIEFTPKQTEIAVSDFKKGDQILIKTNKNIAGKTEFDDVDFINIFP